ncbi:MAG: glutamate formimidoyltransferase [Bacillota bacterium]|nr:glutamate formimidoyltransferase [Bacillota bacterium]
MDKLIECVPNFSEGCRPEVVAGIVDAMRGHGVIVLDVHSDAAHNRSVVTVVGTPAQVLDAAFSACREAAHLIDMERHRGEHPRIGATDVIPLVPFQGTSLDECVGWARELGRRIGEELDIPVYLYGAAATRADRVRLADVRRGEYEGLKEAVARPERQPDFGPARLHPRAGAVAVGARPFLIAFNVNLECDDLEVARSIARAVRESSGGLPAVQALGLRREDGSVQVSMNLLDHQRTSLAALYARVEEEAYRRGVEVSGSELVGLAPAEALLDVVRHFLRAPGLAVDQVLEVRLWHAGHES